MRRISIDKIKSTLSKEIEDLPVGITKRGKLNKFFTEFIKNSVKLVGVIVSPNHCGSAVLNPRTTVVQNPNAKIQLKAYENHQTFFK